MALFVCFPGSAQHSQSSGQADQTVAVRRMTVQTDFKSLSPGGVTYLLDHADQIKVSRSESASTFSPWIKACNGKRSEFPAGEWACYSATGPFFAEQGSNDPSLLLQNMQALFRGCGLYATNQDRSSGGITCGLLGRVFFVLGNMGAARAVWESPGCYALDKGQQVNGCMGFIVGKTKANYVMGGSITNNFLDSTDAFDAGQLRAMAEKACTTVQDAASCDYLRRTPPPIPSQLAASNKIDSLPLDSLQSLAASGNAAAQARLAWVYWQRKTSKEDIAKAIPWFEKAAAQGDPNAEFGLSWFYVDGFSYQGIAIPADGVKCADLMTKAANAGNAYAQMVLGKWYLTGGKSLTGQSIFPIPLDRSLAIQWYERAAAQGMPLADLQLADLDSTRRLQWLLKTASASVPQDDPYESVLWEFVGAQDLNAAHLAEDELGWFYQKQNNRAQAIRWYRKAGDRDALQRLGADGNDDGTSLSQAGTPDQSEQQAEQERQDRISQLQEDMQQQEQFAQDDENRADQLAQDNGGCAAGAYNALCNSATSSIGAFGAAKFRQDAAKARQKAEDDREQIQQLENEPVQHEAIDTSYAGALTRQTQAQPMANIQDTLAQQESGIYAAGACSACSSDPSVVRYRTECKNGSISACYREAAALCECHLNTGGCGGNLKDLQACVRINTKAADSMRGGYTITSGGKANTPTTPNGNNPKAKCTATQGMCAGTAY